MLVQHSTCNAPIISVQLPYQIIIVLQCGHPKTSAAADPPHNAMLTKIDVVLRGKVAKRVPRSDVAHGVDYLQEEVHDPIPATQRG